jgi:hypothetical protein
MLALGGIMLIVLGAFFNIRGMKAGAGLLLFALAYATIVGVWFARQRGSGKQTRGRASGFDLSRSQP